MYHYVYKTTNEETGHYYIGIHSTENKDDGYLGSGSKLKEFISKYGKESFTKTIIAERNTREEIELIEEQEVGDKFKTDDKCLNLCAGGQKGRWELTDEIKTKIGNSMRGFKKTPEQIEKTVKHHRGAKRSDESKKRMSESAKNRPPVSDDTRKKLSDMYKGEKSCWYGKHHTEESKKKMSESKKGKSSGPHSEETKQKIREGNLNKVVTQESINKQKNTKANWTDEQRAEFKRKISETKKNAPIRTCPHCGKEGKSGNMTRYHFDNCKLKKE
jgi:hypothetical protein